jgi:PBP1b-binding outer membrane lipoprotein LpoB
MKSNGMFQKQTAVTDQKTRTNDEHVHELDKQHLKESMDEPNLIPKKGGKHQPAKEE